MARITIDGRTIKGEVLMRKGELKPNGERGRELYLKHNPPVYGDSDIAEIAGELGHKTHQDVKYYVIVPKP